MVHHRSEWASRATAPPPPQRATTRGSTVARSLTRCTPLPFDCLAHGPIASSPPVLHAIPAPASSSPVHEEGPVRYPGRLQAWGSTDAGSWPPFSFAGRVQSVSWKTTSSALQCSLAFQCFIIESNSAKSIRNPSGTRTVIG